MQSKKNIVLGVATFLVFLIIGYGVIKILQPQKTEVTPQPLNIDESGQDADTAMSETIFDDDTISQVVMQENSYDEPNYDVMNSSQEKTVVREKENAGSKTTSIHIEDDVKTSSNKKRNMVSYRDSKPLDKGTGSDFGHGSKDKGYTTEKVQSMTKNEFQSLLRDQNDNILLGVGNEKVSGSVRISVNGMHSDEAVRPTKVQDVREKLYTDTWKDVRVTSVHVDPSTGKIDAATVTPIY